MRIAIYGGSFNPPHRGHVEAAKAAVSVLKPDKLLIIPASIPPHKPLPVGSPDPQERLYMSKLAFSDIDEAEILDIEILREGKSYTIDTINQLQSLYPNAKFFLLIGTDMLLSFEKWYMFKQILENVTLAVFARDEAEDDKLQNLSQYFLSNYGANVTIIHSKPYPMSSSEIRDKLQKREGEEYLPDNIYERIISKRLYGARPNFQWLRAKAYAMLKPSRIPHVQGCEQEAVMLAKRWGANEELAAEAAILHDITKNLMLDEQLSLCESYGIINDNLESTSTKLLHAKTGAAIAEDLFGVSPEVKSAIRWHTTGRPDMTLFEKIMYLADYIEPNRSFEGLETLRALAYENIDDAMLLGLKMSLEELQQYGVTSHKCSLDAIEFLLAGKERL